MNDVDPHAWLTQTLERIAQGWPISQIEALMPWHFAKPERPRLGAYVESAAALQGRLASVKANRLIQAIASKMPSRNGARRSRQR